MCWVILIIKCQKLWLLFSSFSAPSQPLIGKPVETSPPPTGPLSGILSKATLRPMWPAHMMISKPFLNSCRSNSTKPGTQLGMSLSSNLGIQATMHWCMDMPLEDIGYGTMATVMQVKLWALSFGRTSNALHGTAFKIQISNQLSLQVL